MICRSGAKLGWAVVVVCCLSALGCRGQETMPAQPVGAPDANEVAEIVVGPPDAPIKVEAYYPLNEGHQFIADYLKEFAEARPGQVRLEVVDFRTPAGAQRWESTGLTCAGVFVNGRTQYEITTDGETETVSFLKRMGVMWTEEDFEQVVDRLLEEAGVEVEAPAVEAEPESSA
jgi:hypothetical protein